MRKTMSDFAAARRNMVDGQIRTQDVTDQRLIAALLEIPREQFVPVAKAALAYLDLDVPLGDGGRKLLKPMVLAKLVQGAMAESGDHVLDIACGTGYSTVLLAKLCGEVIALEDDAALSRQAQKNLGTRAKIVTGPLAAGWSSGAPYDVILMNGATEIVPQSLFGQLKAGGRLVCVLGAAPGKAMVYLRSGSEVSGRALFDAAAPLLPGFSKTPAFVF
jgi:protein-L-isoaspartate(D-aspartate) O-methyltransferase